MSVSQTTIMDAVLGRLSLSSVDLATRDKVPIIRRLLNAEGPGLALDVGVGTGYTTYSVFGQRRTVCVDVDPANLAQYRDRVASISGASVPLCVVAQASALPLARGVFHFVLCSEVMEHLDDDDAAVAEIARVMAEGGRAIITVPYTGIGFTSFLELLHIKTVHDFPGPERHVRPGYDELSLAHLLERHGLRVERRAFYFRFFTRLIADIVSLAHLLYQRVAYKRRAWKWSDVTAAEASVAIRSYARIFPALWAVSRLDRMLASCRGFGLIVMLRKP